MRAGRTLRVTMMIAAVALIAGACGGSKEEATGDPNPKLPGITDTEIKIGMWWMDNSGGCAKLNVTDPAQRCGLGDEKDFEALAAHVNANGGMAGRKVVPVIYHTLFTGLPFGTSAQQACTYFTQDNPVYAVIAVNNVMGETAKCFAQKKVIVLDPGTYPHDNQDFKEMDPYLYQPNRPRPERWLKAYIEGLASKGFFEGDAKVGLIRYDYPPSARVMESTLKPLLAEKKITLASEAVVAAPTSADALGPLGEAATNTVLKFKSAGVNRVISFTDIGYINNFLYKAAATQRFFPRYGVSSTEFMTFFVTLAEKGQLDGSIGVGWNPNYDLQAAQDPGESPGADQCKTILNDPEGTPTGRNNKCDSILFLKAAFDKAKSLGDLTPLGIRKAVASLGTSFQSAEVFSMKFGPGLYDGPASYRIYEYDGSCSCYKYTGPETPMPDDPAPGID